ncbi:transcriptional regulator [Subsaximicrobium wynnwilliamsii]|uniref:Transcriptional regulator n=1 Tax=Subsaximicrobium wynnwilliamsii TaxID=291179 RepID=A0A5C6ZAY7_9FLAO|nr:transcriptional regulator [Subsaximicrobium wynnwilliamsii]TXD87143.1 transcriptional regulator [Subsaximicrobium wynnwilliamsii]TXE00697.1 transcriptional regulator [Subsaximicrobium wynnwilliamsii]
MFCLCALLLSTKAYAQYTPYFQNFDLSEYNAGNQNWGVSKAKDGKLYVANNKGLLEYDGLNWKLFTIPNKTTLRSVLAKDNKIYIGSYEEFGYFETDAKGKLNYTSLSQMLDGEQFLNEEFWQILAFEDTIIFRSFRNIYVYKAGKITKIRPSSTVISCEVVDGEVYVATLKDGIYKLEGSALVPFLDNAVLDGAKVVSIIKYAEGLLIATDLSGNFLYNGSSLKAWNAPINAILKKYQLNALSTQKSGNLVFGTIQNGIYITNSDGSIVFHINHENGLINNTILSQYIDEDNQLWVGLDNGLAHVDLKSKSAFFNDVTGKLGAVYDVIDYKGRIYIGSNTGLYYLSSDGKLIFIENSQGQVWSLKIVDGDLLCGHNNGTYLVEGDQIELISAFTGGWVIKKVPEINDTYIQGTYSGLVRLKKVKGEWEAKHLGKTTIPIRFLVFEDASTAWAAHAYKGLFKVKFSNTYDTITSIQNYENKGLSSTYNVRVHKIKNTICIKTNTGWQRYEPILDSIVPHDLLNKNFGKNSYIISDDEVNVLALKRGDLIHLKPFDTENSSTTLESSHIKDRLIVGYENVSQLDNTHFGLNLNDGFMRIDKNLPRSVYQVYKPSIDGISVNGAPIAIPNDTPIEIPNKNQSLLIELSSPKSHAHAFQYALTNVDPNHWYKIENGALELSNLGQGEYALAFRTVNESGTTSESTRLYITILPAWYRSNLGLLGFTLLAFLLILLFYVLHKRKILKEQLILKHQFEKDQEILLKDKTIENDKRIVELKNESLENELELKSKQLANTAMAIVKKNETLLELKDELLDHKSAFDNYYAYKKLIKKIDTSIGHEDEWAIFEHNSNQVHEAFFKQLVEKHPDLTPKDLKVCAYIKMDLSTKEIAPLLNISVRGVETQRYRLKQKLQLESEISLTDYLLNFK